MAEERFLAHSAVFILIRNDKGEVLLLRRCNTGFMDGYYDMPSGHVERGEPLLEAAVRELREETGIVTETTDLKLWHVNQFSANNQDYYNFFFVADTWQGTPAIMETDKCDDVRFFAVSKLPKLTAGAHVALDDLNRHQNDGTVTFGFIDQPTYDRIAAI